MFAVMIEFYDYDLYTEESAHETLYTNPDFHYKNVPVLFQTEKAAALVARMIIKQGFFSDYRLIRIDII